MPALQELLDKAGWTATPELSGVFQVGRVFQNQGGTHTLMVRSCFDAPTGTDTYTSTEVVSNLQAGVKVKFGLGSVQTSGDLVKKMSFSTPSHHTIERLAMLPTPECEALLAKVPQDQLAHMYAVQEVLTAEISEQTCGRLDAEGRFVGLGKAEVELARSCMIESLEPVAVGYRVVSLADLGISERGLGPVNPDCPWGQITHAHSTMTSLTINTQTHDVRGRDQRVALVNQLHLCGAHEAAASFDAWRQSRRVVNITGATLVGFYPFGIGILAAGKAHKHRMEMEAWLTNPSVGPPPSRGKRKRR
jgi:hypothetical protein